MLGASEKLMSDMKRLLLCTSVVALCGVSSPYSELTLEQTEALLLEYQSETFSSRHHSSHPSLQRLGLSKPNRHLEHLFEKRQVLWLGGKSWGAVCRAVGSGHCIPSLLKALVDNDPWWRAFSCEALEALEATEAIPMLQKLLEDQMTLGEPPASSSPMKRVGIPIVDPTVSVFAASALASFGRAEGVEQLMDYAERVHAEYRDSCRACPDIDLPYLDHFRKLAGKDFGNDLDAWKAWFKTRYTTNPSPKQR